MKTKHQEENTSMKTKNQIELTPSTAARRNLTTIPAGAGGGSVTLIEEPDTHRKAIEPE